MPSLKLYANLIAALSSWTAECLSIIKQDARVPQQTRSFALDSHFGGPQSSPDWISPNDLWGIHDLVLVGYGAVFLQQGSQGAREVQQAAHDLAVMLPQLHPHAPCRSSISDAINRASGERETVVAAANAAWACLPAAFTSESFVGAYTEQALGDSDAAINARNPSVKDTSVLGACRNSGWPRTCSYWSSMHAMAYRADMLGLSSRFLRSIVPILASGATMCAGCTLHFIALHDIVLSPNVISDQGESF